MKRHRSLRQGAGAAIIGFASIIALALGCHEAPAQGRTIKIINPYPPGGTADIIARLVADQIGRTRGATMVIEDHPGAGALIGTELAARAAPDGGTLLIS